MILALPPNCNCWFRHELNNSIWPSMTQETMETYHCLLVKYGHSYWFHNTTLQFAHFSWTIRLECWDKEIVITLQGEGLICYYEKVHIMMEIHLLWCEIYKSLCFLEEYCIESLPIVFNSFSEATSVEMGSNLLVYSILYQMRGRWWTPPSWLRLSFVLFVS